MVQLDFLSPLRKTPLLQRSMLSSSEAFIQLSQCGYRPQPPIPSCSSSRLHEHCDLVNMFLSSISQRCFGLSHQISRCRFQRDKVEFTRLTHSLGQMFRCYSKIQSVLGQVVSCKQLCILLFHLSSESDSVFRLTPVCLVVSLVVFTASVFVLHPDSLMMSGACLKSGSMSRYCPV